MCGIVGTIGSKPALPILYNGLKQLEYRGYDSSGIALFSDSIDIYKRTGKLNQLSKILPPKSESKIGIGHTRWATHGKVTEENAHPHISMEGRVAVAHNGIIDNYKIIKKSLESKGYNFYSETDSEVIAHLIESNLKDDPEDALLKALSLIEGTYGIVVMFRDFPGLLLGARNGSPLVLGIGNGQKVIASDASAFIGTCTSAIYLDDNEVVVITETGHTIYNQAQSEINKKEELITTEKCELEKGEFDHFLIKEIYEQPDSVLRALGSGSRVVPDWGDAVLGGLNLENRDYFEIDHIHIIGMGTALHAGEIGGYMIQDLAGIPVTVSDASELHYGNPIVKRNTLFFAVSQSGETADTLNCVREIQNKGGKVLGIVNSVGSTLARLSDGGVYIHAGQEISVASTKAFTSQITVFALLALLIGRKRALKQSQGQQLVKEILSIPDKIREVLNVEEQIKKLAKKYKDVGSFLILGRGINYPVAKEGALKIKEISYIHAEGFSSGGLKHGPLALVTEGIPALFLLPEGDTFDKGISNIEEVKARNGDVIIITNSRRDDIKNLGVEVIRVPYTLELLSPLLMVIPLQLLSYYIALELGREIDQPRNLAKSVTTE